MGMIFDSHAHYDDARFDNSRDELLLEISQNGVCGIINCGTDIDTSAFSVSLAEKVILSPLNCSSHFSIDHLCVSISGLYSVQKLVSL